MSALSSALVIREAGPVRPQEQLSVTFCILSEYFTETRRVVSVILIPPLAWDLRKSTSSSLGADTHCSISHLREHMEQRLMGTSYVYLKVSDS